eukprot:TRINITY_DN2525_c0_g1_i2.p1 TRINITY_DN2525_c0_g1~~TRINITY_DN2525_c0_g1_i2.p1  ORF type:complete len:565 (-),score=87.07 TRINITY_DN2525_c0_g1_i2:28-1722(-)
METPDDAPLNILELPRDMTLLIFALMPIDIREQASRVCKLWHEAARDADLCETIDVGKHGYHLQLDNLWRLFRMAGERMKAFNASGRGITDKHLQHLAQFCPELVNLNVSGCSRVTHRGLEVIARRCRNLHTLNVRECINVRNLDCVRGLPLEDISINHSGVSEVSYWIPLLRSLCIRYCFDSMDQIIFASPNLQSLSIGAPLADLEARCGMFTHLHTLSVSTTGAALSAFEKFVRVCRDTMRHLTLLGELDLPLSYGVAVVETLLRGLPLLRTLRVDLTLTAERLAKFKEINPAVTITSTVISAAERQAAQQAMLERQAAQAKAWADANPPKSSPVATVTYGFPVSLGQPPTPIGGGDGKPAEWGAWCPYSLEYAKSGRAECKQCGKNIGQGTVRVGTTVVGAAYNSISWKHLRCFKVPAKLTKAAWMSGFSNLKPEDQARVWKHVEGTIMPGTSSTAASATAATTAAPTPSAVTSAINTVPTATTTTTTTAIVADVAPTATTRTKRERKQKDEAQAADEPSPPSKVSRKRATKAEDQPEAVVDKRKAADNDGPRRSTRARAK